MADNLRLPQSNTIIVDSNGTPLSGAKIEIFDAGTTNQKNVFSDADLLVAAANPIVADGTGNIPVRYIGTGAYKVTYRDSADQVLTNYDTEDNVPGALDTSGFLTGSVSPTRPVVSVSTNTTLTATEDGKQINADSTGGDITITLRSAVTMGDGNDVVIKSSGTANNVTISATQLIDTKNSYILNIGDSATFRSDGGNFHIAEAYNYTDDIVVTTYASTIALDFSFPTDTDHQITLTGALTLNAPTNLRIGQRGTITLIQDATGGHVTTFNAVFKGDPNIDTTALFANKLNFHVRSLTEIDLWPSQPPAQVPRRTLIETINPTSGTTVTFSNIVDTFTRLEIEFDSVTTQETAGLSSWRLSVKVSDDNASTFNVVDGFAWGIDAGNSETNNANTTGEMALANQSLQELMDGVIEFPMYNNSSENKLVFGKFSAIATTAGDIGEFQYVTTDSAGPIDAIELEITTGTLAFLSGEFRLYGLN